MHVTSTALPPFVHIFSTDPAVRRIDESNSPGARHVPAALGSRRPALAIEHRTGPGGPAECNLSEVRIRFRLVGGLLAGLVALGPAAAAWAQAFPTAAERSTPATPEPPTYRIFLADGASIATLGEFARVGDRLVFTLPLAPGRDVLSSLPAARVDWERTNRYTEVVRAARYAETRGEADFAAMSTMVARTLSDIAITPGPSAQLELAERARRTLADWPRQHHNYRVDEVRQTVSLLDEVIAGLRAAAGRTSFDVSFVATTLPPQVETLRPKPSLQESIEQALRLTELAASAAERTTLLHQVEAALGDGSGTLPAAWVSATRARAASALEVERNVDRAYATLAERTLQSIDRSARAGDVKRIVDARTRLVARDRALGSKRPDHVQSLLDAIDQRLDAARRVRLARDRFAARLPALRAFREGVAPIVSTLAGGRGVLADIKTLAGPSAGRLSGFIGALDGRATALRRLPVPAEAQGAHASLASAFQLAGTAARYRQRAIAANDMKLAWDASAAAAGALLLLQRAESDLVKLFEQP